MTALLDQQSSRPGTPKTRFVIFAIAPCWRRGTRCDRHAARGLVERPRPPEELFLRVSTRMPADAFAPVHDGRGRRC
jgi:hypothetical protein